METGGFCPTCGAALPPGALFCARCGTAVEQLAPPPAPLRPTTVAPRARRPLWILAVPLGIVLVAGLVWALLSGMPFGTRDTAIRPGSAASSTAPAPATIGEGSEASTTVAQIDEPGAVQTAPPLPPIQVQPQTTASQPVVVPMTPARRLPANPPMASSVVTISEADAMTRLRDVLLATSNISDECLDIRSLGFRNAGYTLDAVDSCATDSSSLGRWRVDAVTREVFRQNASGRYVKP